jgi:hypothetical protein
VGYHVKNLLDKIRHLHPFNDERINAPADEAVHLTHKQEEIREKIAVFHSHEDELEIQKRD